MPAAMVVRAEITRRVVSRNYRWHAICQFEMEQVEALDGRDEIYRTYGIAKQVRLGGGVFP